MPYDPVLFTYYFYLGSSGISLVVVLVSNKTLVNKCIVKTSVVTNLLLDSRTSVNRGDTIMRCDLQHNL